MCAVSSTYTKTQKATKKKFHMSCVTINVTHAACQLSPVKQTATATDPPPAKASIIHSRLVCKTLIDSKP